MKLKYVGESATGFRNPATDEVLAVKPGEVVEVKDAFGALLLKTNAAAFTALDPEVPPQPGDPAIPADRRKLTPLDN